MREARFSEGLTSVYHAWTVGLISDAAFVSACTSLSNKAMRPGAGDRDLIWIQDALTLVREGVVPHHAWVRRVNEVLEPLIRG